MGYKEALRRSCLIFYRKNTLLTQKTYLGLNTIAAVKNSNQNIASESFVALGSKYTGSSRERTPSGSEKGLRDWSWPHSTAM